MSCPLFRRVIVPTHTFCLFLHFLGDSLLYFDLGSIGMAVSISITLLKLLFASTLALWPNFHQENEKGQLVKMKYLIGVKFYCWDGVDPFHGYSSSLPSPTPHPDLCCSPPSLSLVTTTRRWPVPRLSSMLSSSLPLLLLARYVIFSREGRWLKYLLRGSASGSLQVRHLTFLCVPVSPGVADT